jgi:hypothetical protein
MTAPVSAPEPGGAATPETPAPTTGGTDPPMVPFEPDHWITDLVEKTAIPGEVKER